MWGDNCQIVFEYQLQKCNVLINNTIPANRSLFFIVDSQLLLCDMKENIVTVI